MAGGGASASVGASSGASGGGGGGESGAGKSAVVPSGGEPNTAPASKIIDTSGMRKASKASSTDEQKSVNKTKNGELGGLEGQGSNTTVNNTFISKTEINISSSSSFNLQKTESAMEYFYTRLVDQIDKKLMLAILLAIQQKRDEDLIKLLEIAMEMAAMNTGMVSMMG